VAEANECFMPFADRHFSSVGRLHNHLTQSSPDVTFQSSTASYGRDEGLRRQAVQSRVVVQMSEAEVVLQSR